MFWNDPYYRECLSAKSLTMLFSLELDRNVNDEIHVKFNVTRGVVNKCMDEFNMTSKHCGVWSDLQVRNLSYDFQSPVGCPRFII